MFSFKARKVPTEKIIEEATEKPIKDCMAIRDGLLYDTSKSELLYKTRGLAGKSLFFERTIYVFRTPNGRYFSCYVDGGEYVFFETIDEETIKENVPVKKYIELFGRPEEA